MVFSKIQIRNENLLFMDAFLTFKKQKARPTNCSPSPKKTFLNFLLGVSLVKTCFSIALFE